MDLVLCRPCGRITTELKDLMVDVDLVEFYAFFAKQEDVLFKQHIQICVGCEKKLNAAFEFHKTCLSSESLWQTCPSPVKKSIDSKKTPARQLIRLLSPEDMDQTPVNEPAPSPLDVHQGPGNVVQMTKTSRNSVSETADLLEDESTNSEECVTDHIETKTRKLETNHQLDEEELLKSMRQISCPICKSKVYKSQLEYHMNLHVLTIEQKAKQANIKLPYVELPPKNGKKRFHCKFEGCGAILNSPIDVHMLNKHFPELKKLMCSVCGEKFSTKQTLDTHMNNHLDYLPLQCDKCTQRFRRSSHLRLHMRSKHQNIRYNCKDCGKQYSNSSTFKYHVLLKHKGAKLVCNVCDQNFTHRCAMERHLHKQHQLSFNQSIHIVLPNNEKLLRSSRITDETVFSSEKFDEIDYS